VPVRIEKNILWFHISINHALGIVEKFNRHCDFGCIKSRGTLVEPPCATQVAEDLASGAVVQLQEGQSTSRKQRWIGAYQHIQTLTVREGTYQGCDKRVTGHIRKGSPFVANMLDLLEFDHCVDKCVSRCSIEQSTWPLVPSAFRKIFSA
jgi:hypothetical protein